MPCKQRALCPSCAAKRGWELAAFLVDHVLEDVAHAQWVVTIPKMLRPGMVSLIQTFGDRIEALIRYMMRPPLLDLTLGTVVARARRSSRFSGVR